MCYPSIETRNCVPTFYPCHRRGCFILPHKDRIAASQYAVLRACHFRKRFCTWVHDQIEKRVHPRRFLRGRHPLSAPAVGPRHVAHLRNEVLRSGKPADGGASEIAQAGIPKRFCTPLHMLIPVASCVRRGLTTYAGRATPRLKILPMGAHVLQKLLGGDG